MLDEVNSYVIHLTVMYLITMYQFQGGLIHHFSLISVMIIWWISWARFSINENQLVIFKLCCFFRTIRPAYVNAIELPLCIEKTIRIWCFLVLRICPLNCIFYIIPYQFILKAQYNKTFVGKESVVNIFIRNCWIFENW